MVTKYCVIILIALLMTGCSPGRLFTNITRPYTINFNDTPEGTKTCRVIDHKIKEPITRVGVSGEWSSATIDSAMHKTGMTNVYYADVKEISVLGVYRQKTLILYGD